ncbi:hypothetical protein A8709_15355 [Paenibacillus pectinilyticus]|uniref:Uncharacterized protein n=1 Tax=Paenibacillus pectinilyticus TaxID=512399 RepID=A0A1C1A4H4_9BACL|nr:Ger(x)C family spore germination protein [Paenibacillus pectinilyticus]OCT15453.1 hypothetical protein A8709_15355 [Paenibacillus pectinilyticus]
MIKSFQLLIVLVILLLVTIGCVKQTVIDQITIPIVAGLDKGPGSTTRLTISSPYFKGKDAIKNFESTAFSRTTQNARDSLQNEQELPIMLGKLSVVLIGQELAKNGLDLVLDPPLRDPRISNRMYLAVVDGRAQQLLEKNYTNRMEKGRYIAQQISSNIKEGHLPRTSLHLFESAWLGQGHDPYLPLLKAEEAKIEIAGLALFADDKFVGSLNSEEMKFFRLLVENTDNSTFEIPLNNDAYVSVQNNHSGYHYTVSNNSGIPEFKIRIRINGTITESTTSTTTDLFKHNVEAAFSKMIVQTSEKLIQKFQQLGIDPLGLGELSRSRTRHWDESKWREQYPTVKVNVDAKVKITETGSIK